ncbi:hypothetical protein BRYFOR_09399 [Marvinbryantia formatexigens DSM 14469]|uniref:Uncharacterized protein n=1 Tax=Marvinbryantia formatexigens DSM 14469 TaxID=478749 RepID=C6LL52_9FIRM|nr:hypothetical protein BRYFOR_09399 [Marvinbryantia formatexigens DSM 14469]
MHFYTLLLSYHPFFDKIMPRMERKARSDPWYHLDNIAEKLRRNNYNRRGKYTLWHMLRQR